MDPVSIAIGAAGGGVLGLAIAFSLAKKGKSDLVGRLEKTKDEADRIKRETKDQLKALKEGQSESQKELDTAKGKVAALEEAVAQAREQANQLSTSLQEAEGARARAQEQAQSHGSTRQQAEGKARQAQEQARAAQRNLEEVELRLKQLEEEHAKVKQTADRRGQEIQQLRSQASPDSASGLDQSIEAFAEAAGSLPDILRILQENESQQAVVLADANGIVVAAAGEPSLTEGMAAAARLVAGLSSQLEGMVPFGKVRSFQIQDSQTVIAGRAFDCTGEMISLATFGTREPARRMIDGAVANVSAVLD